jgi:hypothetical protein
MFTQFLTNSLQVHWYLDHYGVVKQAKLDILDWPEEGKAGFMMAENVDEFIEGVSLGLFDLELVLLHIAII